MLKLETSRLQMLLHTPGDGFYEGTRFDRSGVWESLLFQGKELCAPWYGEHKPLMHDAVRGPAEEFAPIPGIRPGTLVKIGVGLLEAHEKEYDRFKLYPVLDAGEWDSSQQPDKVVFRHRLKGYYTYVKEIALTGESAFEIRHSLELECPAPAFVYNHNFFTMGKLEVGPSRQVDFPFTPQGQWRADYNSVALTPSGVRFLRPLLPGETVYNGSLHQAGATGMPYRLTLREGPLSVHISAPVPCTHTVLWANPQIACLEPYNKVTPSWPVSYVIETE